MDSVKVIVIIVVDIINEIIRKELTLWREESRIPRYSHINTVRNNSYNKKRRHKCRLWLSFAQRLFHKTDLKMIGVEIKMCDTATL